MESDKAKKFLPLIDITNQVKNGSEDTEMSEKTVIKRNGTIETF